MVGVQGEPALVLDDGTPEGHVCGAVVATMLHRLFDTPEARRRVLDSLRARRGLAEPVETVEPPDPYEALADHVQRYVDCDRLRDIARGAL
jgi:cobyric acid synthase